MPSFLDIFAVWDIVKYILNFSTSNTFHPIPHYLATFITMACLCPLGYISICDKDDGVEAKPRGSENHA